MGPMIEFTAANVVALTGADLSATLNGVPMPSLPRGFGQTGRPAGFWNAEIRLPRLPGGGGRV